jgi:hypothetical protein
VKAAPADTKIFGLRIGVDPKVLVAGLIAVAVGLFWYNSRSSEDSAPLVAAVAHGGTANAPEAAAVRPRIPASARRARNANNNGSLRLRPIDPTRGDVDPTLRLDLLTRLQRAQLAASGRSLFEVAPAPLPAADQKLLKNPPTVPKVPPTNSASAAAADQPLNIPLKYYGFAKSSDRNEGSQGLFLDGDNVVVGTEGELIMKKYLVVSLTPASARLEDTQLKKGQTLVVVPAASTP